MKLEYKEKIVRRILAWLRASTGYAEWRERMGEGQWLLRFYSFHFFLFSLFKFKYLTN